MLVPITIDRTPSELQIGSEALTWWRSNDQHQHQAKISPIKQLVKHLSSTSIDRLHEHQPEQRTSSSILTAPQPGGPNATQPINKKRKRIEFSQIVGLLKVGPRTRSNRCRKRDKSDLERDISNDSISATSSSNQNKPGEAKQESSVRKLKVYYAEKSDKSTGRLLKLKKIIIEEAPARLETGSTTEQQHTRLTLGQLHDLIERNLLLRRRERPKRLLIFVNPYGGKGKAVQLYEKKVKRILELGQVEVELVVTQYANHARETLEDPNFDLERFDGIVCIGGDGMFSELMNGLLFRSNGERLLKGPSEQEQRANLHSSMELDSIDGGPSESSSDSCSSSSSPSPSLATLDPDDQLQRPNCDDTKGDRRKTKVILEENNNSNNNKSRNSNEKDCSGSETAASGAANSNKSNRQSFQQQLEFLRSSLGGIGERFQSPNIPIGVIGAGSTDANLFGFIGTNDPVTATLNIMLGNQIQIDVGSVHSIRDDRLLRFVSTFVAYGYFGDVVRESEKLRWLGPSRYDLTAVNSLIKYRDYHGLVRILSSPRDGSPRDLNRCHLNCRLCQNQISNTLSFNDFSHLSRPSNASDELELERIRSEQQTQLKQQQALDDLDQFELVERRGPFVGVNAAVTACRCPQTRKGFSPGNHLANGCADLILVRPCSRIQYINYLIRTGYTNKSAFDLKYVEAYRCRQFEFIVDGQPPAGEAGEPNREQSPSSGSSSGDYQTSTLGYGSMSTIKESSHESASSSGDNLSMARRHPNRDQQERLPKRSAAKRREDESGDDVDDEANQWTSSWNVDGEILTEQSIRVKVNNKLLRVFGTGEPVQKHA